MLRMETALAQGSMDRVEMRDPAKRYHIMTVAQVQKLSPNFDWQTRIWRHRRGPGGKTHECVGAGFCEDL